MDEEKDEPIRDGLTNLMHWDKFVIVIAAVLSMCWVAMMFKPSLGVALTHVLEQEDAPQPAAEAAVSPEPVTPGVVTTFIYPSAKKTDTSK